MGSFRLAAGRGYLHPQYNFAESLVETAGMLLCHSCRSELHVIPRFPVAQTIPSPEPSDPSMSLLEYFRFPDGFIFIARSTIVRRPRGSWWLPVKTNWQIRSNLTTSSCFAETSG